MGHKQCRQWCPEGNRQGLGYEQRRQRLLAGNQRDLVTEESRPQLPAAKAVMLLYNSRSASPQWLPVARAPMSQGSAFHEESRQPVSKAQSFQGAALLQLLYQSPVFQALGPLQPIHEESQPPMSEALLHARHSMTCPDYCLSTISKEVRMQ